MEEDVVIDPDNQVQLTRMKRGVFITCHLPRKQQYTYDDQWALSFTFGGTGIFNSPMWNSLYNRRNNGGRYI